MVDARAALLQELGDRESPRTSAPAARCATRRRGSAPPAPPRAAPPRSPRRGAPSPRRAPAPRRSSGPRSRRGRSSRSCRLPSGHPPRSAPGRRPRPSPAPRGRPPARPRTAGRPPGRDRPSSRARARPRGRRPSTRSAAATTRSLRIVSTRRRRWERRRRSISPLDCQVLPVPLDLVQHSSIPSSRAGDGLEDRRQPLAVLADRQHHLEVLAPCRSTPSRSALLMTKTSAISRMPALIAWMSSPEAGDGHHDDRVDGAHHVHLVLADADRLDQHPVEAGGVEQVDGVARGAGEPPHGCRGWPSSG